MNTEGCGTKAGYQRHRRNGGRACEPCLEANRAYNRIKYQERHPRTNRKARLLVERIDRLKREYGGMTGVARAYTAAHGGRESAAYRMAHRILNGQHLVWESTYEKWMVL